MYTAQRASSVAWQNAMLIRASRPTLSMMITPRSQSLLVGRNSSLILNRGYAQTSTSTASTKSPTADTSSSTSSSSSPPPPSPPPRRKKRSLFGRLLLLTTISGLISYGGGTYASLKSETFRDSFTDSIPFAEVLVDAFEDWEFNTNKGTLPDKEDVRTLKDKALNSSPIIGKAKDTKSEDERRKSLQEQVANETTASENNNNNSNNKSINEPSKPSVSNKAEEDKSTNATGKAPTAKPAENEEELKKQTTHDTKETLFQKSEPQEKAVVQPVFESATKATTSTTSQPTPQEVEVPRTGYADTMPERKVDGRPQAPKEIPGEVYDGPLPLGWEPPPGYKLAKSKKSEDDKSAISSLPLLAPSISEISTAEPTLGQMAQTIDDLTSFLRDTPGSLTQESKATKVLETAKMDLESLGTRLAKIKEEEQKKATDQLTSLRKEADEKLSTRERELVGQMEELDGKWRDSIEEERKKILENYRDKFTREADAYRDEVEGRLREEVTAQGVAMQRRWLRDVKVAVEKERGGRLARLDELEKDVRELSEQIRLNNTLSDRQEVANKFWTGVRSLTKTALAGGNTFDEIKKELNFLRVVAADAARVQRETDSLKINGSDTSGDEKTDELVDMVIATIANATSAGDSETLIPTEEELAWRFTGKVAPALRRAALMPERDGSLGKYFASAAAASMRVQTSAAKAGDEDSNSEVANVEGIVGATESLLGGRDVEGATRLLNTLEGWPRTLASDWLEAARRHLEIRQALCIAESEAALQALAVAS